MKMYNTHGERVDLFPTWDVYYNDEEKGYKWDRVDDYECDCHSLVILVLITRDHFYIIKMMRIGKDQSLLPIIESKLDSLNIWCKGSTVYFNSTGPSSTPGMFIFW